MGIQFHESVRGARFLESTAPSMVRAINRLAEALEKSNELKTEEKAPAPAVTELSLLDEAIFFARNCDYTQNPNSKHTLRAYWVVYAAKEQLSPYMLVRYDDVLKKLWYEGVIHNELDQIPFESFAEFYDFMSETLH